MNKTFHVFNATDKTFVTHMPRTEREAARLINKPPKKITKGKAVVLVMTDITGKILVNG